MPGRPGMGRCISGGHCWVGALPTCGVWPMTNWAAPSARSVSSSSRHTLKRCVMLSRSLPNSRFHITLVGPPMACGEEHAHTLQPSGVPQRRYHPTASASAIAGPREARYEDLCVNIPSYAHTPAQAAPLLTHHTARCRPRYQDRMSACLDSKQFAEQARLAHCRAAGPWCHRA